MEYLETNNAKVTGNVVNTQVGGEKLIKDAILLVATEAKASRSRP